VEGVIAADSFTIVEARLTFSEGDTPLVSLRAE